MISNNEENTKFTSPIVIDTSLPSSNNNTDSEEEEEGIESDDNLDLSNAPVPANQNAMKIKEVEAYVDFTEYYESLQSMSIVEKEDFERTMSIKSVMRTISEEPS